MSNIQTYQQQQMQIQQSNVLPNLGEMMRFAEMVASSDMVPKDFRDKPSNCLVAIQWGYEVGLAPMQALQNIAVINGRPSIWGDSALALVRASGRLQYFDEAVKDGTAVCIVQRVGEQRVQRTFSVADAKRARLWEKQGPWTQYPDRMLQMRARSWALRDVFPDVLKGVGVREENQDIPEDKPEYKPKQKIELEPKPERKMAEPKFPDRPTLPGVSNDQTETVKDFAKELGMTSKQLSEDVRLFLGCGWKEASRDQADSYLDELSARIAKQDAIRMQNVDVKALQQAGVKS